MAISAGKAAVGGGAIGTVVGAGGIYEVFKLLNLKDVLTNTGPPIAMLDGLAIFCMLALFAVWAYSRAVQDPGTGRFNQWVAVGVFAAIVLLAGGTLAYLAGKENKLQLTANFGNAELIKFHFVPDPAASEIRVNATINDGSPHDFDGASPLDLLFNSATGKITVGVDGLRELETIYGRYETLLKKQTLVLQSCSSEGFTHRLTAPCADTLRSIIQAGGG